MNTRFFLATIALAAGALMAKDYKGGELYTNETWMYGKFEARMQMAAGSGTVSSMFLYHNDSYLGGNEPWVEIDIEILGKNPNSFQSNIITGYGPGNGLPDRKVTSEEHHAISPASNQSFHTYSMEWTPDYVAWILDGKVVRKTIKGQGDNNQVQDLTKKPQGLRFNLWSHEDAGWVGAWNDNILPVYQFINWVKVYEYTPGQGDNGSDFELKWTDNFDNLDRSRWNLGDWTFDGNRVDITPSNIFVKDGMLVIALTKKDAAIPADLVVPQDSENNPQSSNSNNPGMSSSSQSQYNTDQSSSSTNKNTDNRKNQKNNLDEDDNDQTDAIRPAKVFRDSHKIRGTVNAKGARVSETNKAHYQVDFNY